MFSDKLINNKKKPSSLITSVSNITISKSCDANNNTKPAPVQSFGTYRIARKQCRQRHALPIDFKSSANSAKNACERDRAKSESNAKTDSIIAPNNANISSIKSTKHRPVALSNVGHKTIAAVLPEPCRTCGRPNQPERLHSHPETPLKNANNAGSLKSMEDIPKIPGEL